MSRQLLYYCHCHKCVFMFPCSVQASLRTQPALLTGCPTRKSCPATTASAASPPNCPSITAAPVAKECVTTVPRSAELFRHGAGTIPYACVPAATRNLENFNGAGGFERHLSEHQREPLCLSQLQSIPVSMESRCSSVHTVHGTHETFSSVQSSCGLHRAARTCELLDRE